MPHQTLRSLALSAVWLCCAPACLAQANETWQAELEALFAPYDQTDAPGLAVGIERDGEIVFARGYGMADLEHNVPVTPDTIFHAASISKQFTAFSIALLAQENALSVEDDIRVYLPDMPEFEEPVLVRHLISHTSGLRSFGDLFMLGGQEMDSVWRHGQVLSVIERQTALDFAPGSEHTYNNTGYALLAEITERASGQSMRDFLHDRVFAPLGMTHSRIGDDSTEIIPNRALSYAPGAAGDNELAWHRQFLNFETIGSTGLKTNVTDLLIWGHNFEELAESSPDLFRTISTSAALNDGTPINYAYGLTWQNFAGHRSIGHSGSEAAFRARIAHFPAENVSMVVLSNMHVDNASIVEDMARIYLGEGDDHLPGAIAPQIEPGPDLIDALAGTYLYEFGRLFTLEIVEGELIWSERDGASQSPLIFHADGSFEQEGRRHWTYFTPVYSDDGHSITALIRHDDPDRAVRMERTTQWSPEPSDLSIYEGDYFSPEVDQTWTIELKGNALYAHSLWSIHDLPLTPAIEDRFDSEWPLNTLIFDRDELGEITGLRIHSGRARNVIFSKLGGAE